MEWRTRPILEGGGSLRDEKWWGITKGKIFILERRVWSCIYGRSWAQKVAFMSEDYGLYHISCNKFGITGTKCLFIEHLYVSIALPNRRRLLMRRVPSNPRNILVPSCGKQENERQRTRSCTCLGVYYSSMECK